MTDIDGRLSVGGSEILVGKRLAHRWKVSLGVMLLLGTVGRAVAADGWFPFNPAEDTFGASPMDLRHLNEQVAGMHGFIRATNGHFVSGQSNMPLRFWAVNGPSSRASSPAALRQTARRLAKYGVNLVRVHGPVFDRDGEVDPAKIERSVAIVDAMREEGIYTEFSIYFPLWFTPRADHPWLQGYDGKTHPFAALMFHPTFQEKYRSWWQRLLSARSERTGRRLVEEPAVFGLEVQNEDSFFFWTFRTDGIPDAQLRLLETRFGTWLKARYGSLDAAMAAWKGTKVARDQLAEGRVSFRPLWNMANERTARDQDTARFLFEVQEQFYAETVRFLRQLGFRGVITASNWATASPEVFGPLEKMSYAVTDFVDRHGYFGCFHKGDNAAWSIRAGHTYADRSALRFDAEEPGKPKQFVHPVMDVQYAGLPSMISETTFTRPNRYRSEAPLYYAAYGALQESDAIVHFALDSETWAVKPGFWTQPWTLMTPAMMGQFPAAALMYRRGMLAPGDVVARMVLPREELLQLKGTPLPQDASFDELRLADVPQGKEVRPGQRLDPLLHYVGRSEVTFSDGARQVEFQDLARWVDRSAQRVRSTTGELSLDYGRGILTLNAPRAQGVSGNLAAAGVSALADVEITSPMELGHIVVVALDDQPLRSSRRMLVQVMSEEKPAGFVTEPAGPSTHRIKDLGADPWQVRDLAGRVRFQRSDAPELKVQALDLNGYPMPGELQNAGLVELRPNVLYYFVGTDGGSGT